MESSFHWRDLWHASPWQWCFAFALFVLAGSVTYFFEVHPYLQMRASLAQTQAVVTQVEPTNHMLVHYRFTAAGLVWRGAGCGDADTLHPGDPLTVYYDARHPSNQSLDHPDTYIAGGIFGMLFIGSLVAVFGFAFSAGLLRQLRAPNQVTQRTG